MADKKTSLETDLVTPQDTDLLRASREISPGVFESGRLSLGAVKTYATQGYGTPLQIAPIADRYYFSSMVAVVDQQILTESFEDTLLATPFVVTVEDAWTRIGINSPGSGGADANIRLGIYQAGSDGLPGSLLVDAGEVSVPGVSGGDAAITISQTLTPGTYWLAIAAESAECPLAGFQFNDISSAPYANLWGSLMCFGADSSTPAAGFSSTYANALHVAHTYGALPSSFGAPDGYWTDIAPAIFMRKV